MRLFLLRWYSNKPGEGLKCRKVKEKSKRCFILSVQTWVHTWLYWEKKIRKLTYLADRCGCRYFCLRVWLPDLFLEGVQMCLLKVRTMWLIKPVISNGKKVSLVSQVCECVPMCECVCMCVCEGALLTCDTLVRCCKRQIWMAGAGAAVVAIIALQPFRGAI